MNVKKYVEYLVLLLESDSNMILNLPQNFRIFRNFAYNSMRNRLFDNVFRQMSQIMYATVKLRVPLGSEHFK
jgi:hypothetical protein